MAIGKGCFTCCILEKWKKNIHPIPYCCIRFPTTDSTTLFLEQDGVKGQPSWVLVQCSLVQLFIAVIWVGVLESCGYPEVTATISDNPVHMHMAGIPILPIPASTWKASADSTFASEPPPRSCYKAQGPRNGSHKMPPKKWQPFFSGKTSKEGGINFWKINFLIDSIFGRLEVESISTKVHLIGLYQEMTLCEELYLKGWWCDNWLVRWLEPHPPNCWIERSCQNNSYSSWWLQPNWKNISQNGNLPQIGVKIKNLWNHQLVIALLWVSINWPNTTNQQIAKSKHYNHT